jgi:hypothetical protein
MFRISLLNILNINDVGNIIKKYTIIITIGEINLPKISPNLIHPSLRGDKNFGKVKEMIKNNKLKNKK